MTINKTMEAPVLATLIALSMASANLSAEQKYRFPPMEEATLEASQGYPAVVSKQAPEPINNQTPTKKTVQVKQPVIKTYPRTIPPGAQPPIARPYGMPGPGFNRPIYRGQSFPNQGHPMQRYARPYAPAPYAAAPLNRSYRPYLAPVPRPYNARPLATPPNAVQRSYYPPVAGPGPYRAGPRAYQRPVRAYPGAPWNRNYRSGPFNNRSFGRNFFDKGPFKHGPFGRKSPPWEYDEDDNFGFFDIIPSEELEEIWDEMIAGPEDGEIPGPMDWPSIEMPGPFEVGEQVEDVMYEVPSFFGDGYGYDSEND